MAVEVRCAPIQLPASPEVVFDVLADLSTWPVWSPEFTLASSHVAEGRGLTINIGFLPGPTLPVPGRWLVLDRGRKLSWGGGVPGLLSLDHGFELRGEGATTTLSHYERFGGAVGLTVAPLRGTVRAAYERMNAGLRTYLVANAPTGG